MHSSSAEYVDAPKSDQMILRLGTSLGETSDARVAMATGSIYMSDARSPTVSTLRMGCAPIVRVSYAVAAMAVDGDVSAARGVASLRFWPIQSQIEQPGLLNQIRHGSLDFWEFSWDQSTIETIFETIQRVKAALRPTHSRFESGQRFIVNDLDSF